MKHVTVKAPTSPLLAEFRSKGFDIEINHYRLFKVVSLHPTTGKIETNTISRTLHSLEREIEEAVGSVLHELLAKGGSTEVSVIDKETNTEYVATSRCHSDENFNKRVGVDEALKQIKVLVETPFENLVELGK